jgi:hypothetical protein
VGRRRYMGLIYQDVINQKFRYTHIQLPIINQIKSNLHGRRIDMVKVSGLIVESIENGKRNVVVSLVADTKDEVNACGASGENVKGLNADDVIVLGSSALCADGNFGLISSNGQWNW